MTKTLIFICAGILYTVYGTAQTKIHLEEASKNIGKIVTICDKISSGKFLENSKIQPTLLNMGGLAPNNKLTIVINPEDRKNFPAKPEDAFTGKNVCVTGKLIEYKGKPEIVITRPNEIQTVSEGGGGDPEIGTKDFLWFEQ